MKRIGYLFEQAFTREGLLAAFHAAAKGKRKKRACFNFERRLAHNLDRLYDALHDGSYTPQPYYSFTVYEPKKRQIYAPAFADLVVQHAIYAVTLPIFNPSFIDQSFACRPGKGTHKAAHFAQRALQLSAADSYTLKLDIRKFFYRIDRTILRRLIAHKIKDHRFVDLMMLFAEYGEPVGIPIGNLLSQMYALIYLNPLDHFVKRELKVRLYCRYVDDSVLFGLPRERALSHLARVGCFIQQQLNLEFSKTTLATTRRGVNFVGYRAWASRRFIRKHSIYTFRRRAKQGRLESCVSVLGHARHTHSLQHLLRYLKGNHHVLFCQLPKIYQRKRLTRTQIADQRAAPSHRHGTLHTGGGDLRLVA
jgi:RNA-directed DNA polymerase